MVAKDKHSSLLWTLVNYGCIRFYNIGPMSQIPKKTWVYFIICLGKLDH